MEHCPPKAPDKSITLSSLQTRTDTSTNTVDPDETARNEPSLQFTALFSEIRNRDGGGEMGMGEHGGIMGRRVVDTTIKFM